MFLKSNVGSYESSVQYSTRFIHLEHWHKMENNVKIDVEVIWWEGVKWIIVTEAKDQWKAVANTLINHRVPEKSGNY